MNTQQAEASLLLNKVLNMKTSQKHKLHIFINGISYCKSEFHIPSASKLRYPE